jgi:hypothetical protein
MRLGRRIGDERRAEGSVYEDQASDRQDQREESQLTHFGVFNFLPEEDLDDHPADYIVG